MLLQPANRLGAFIGTEHSSYGFDKFVNPCLLTLQGTGITLPDGAWLTPINLALGGMGIGFDTNMAVSPINLTLSGTGIGFDTAEPPPLALTLQGTGIGLAVDFARLANVSPWLLRLRGTGITLPEPIALTLLGTGIGFDTDTATTRRTYCYNLRSKGGPQATELTNFEFIRIIPIQGHLLGLKADGLYELGGTTDNGMAIESSFTLAPFVGAPDKAGRAWMSRCRWVHAGINAEAEITALTDEDGSETYAESPAYAFGKGRANARRAQMGGGLRSGLWGFHIASPDGERMKTAWLEFDFEPLSRRI